MFELSSPFVQALQDTKTKSKLHIEDMKQRFKERYTEATNMLKSQLQKIFQQCKSLEQRLQQEEVILHVMVLVSF